MRTGAAGVLVGIDRADLGVGVPLATALADARSARVRHLDESGVYCHVIGVGGVRSGADVAKAIACGADAVMVGTESVENSAAEGLAELLRRAMATCGYTDLKSFQKADLMVAP
jgi:IMP dehydrogenase